MLSAKTKSIDRQQTTDNSQQTMDIEVKRVEKGKMAGQQNCH